MKQERSSLRPPGLVGRRIELGRALERLGEARVLTIRGPAGIGKSVFAQELGWQAKDRDDELGVYTCDAERVTDAATMLDALLATLDVPIAADGARALIAVVRALKSRGRLLVVVDQCDSLDEGARHVLTQVIAGAPETRFIATARAAMGTRDEVVFELGPLSLPALDTRDAVLASDAGALLVMVARRTQHEFELTADNAAAVAMLLRMVDGLPLALELAGARLAVMPPRALVHRLTTTAAANEHTWASLTPKSLETAIASAAATLMPGELRALLQCTVFRGSFDITAAEGVLDPGEPGRSVADVISSLCAKSLLRSRTVDDDVRLSMYAVVREHVLARQLDAEILAAARRRHADYYLSLAEPWAQHLDRAEARAALVHERDNLLSIAEGVLGGEPPTARAAEPALRALVALGPVLLAQGPIGRFAKLLAPVLGVTSASGANPVLLARVLALRGELLLLEGRAVDGFRDLRQAHAIAEKLDDTSLPAELQLTLGTQALLRSDFEAAEPALRTAKALFAMHSIARGELLATIRLAVLDAAQRAPRDARVELERAIETAKRKGADALRAEATLEMSRIDLDEGADRLADEEALLAQELAIRTGDTRLSAIAVGLRGLCAHARGDLQAAWTHLANAESTLASLGFRVLEAIHCGYLGILCRELGKPAEAYARLFEAAGVLANTDDREHLALFVVHRAGLELDGARQAEARAIFAQLVDAPMSDRAHIVYELELARVDATVSPSLGRLSRAAHVRIAARAVSLRAEPQATVLPDDALVVQRAAGWFRVPHGERVDLRSRRALGRVLERLVRERVASPARPLAWDALLEAGWPGERVIPEAGAHRVRVALSTLRKLGLRDTLETIDAGYRLAVKTPVVLAD